MIDKYINKIELTTSFSDLCNNFKENPSLRPKKNRAFENILQQCIEQQRRQNNDKLY